MAITKVFRSGNSQAVRIPKQFQVDVDEMEITRRGEELVLRKRPRSLAGAYELLTGLSKDFLTSGRKQPKPQKRPAL
jgi:antitoxin VapB